jgi:hypothetical protein
MIRLVKQLTLSWVASVIEYLRDAGPERERRTPEMQGVRYVRKRVHHDWAAGLVARDFPAANWGISPLSSSSWRILATVGQPMTCGEHKAGRGAPHPRKPRDSDAQESPGTRPAGREIRWQIEAG